MIKINSPEDVYVVSEKIIGNLVNNKLTYFSVLVGEEGTLSPCFFTPTAQVSKGKSLICVEDYEKILKLLLSHPHVSNIEYDEKRNMIFALFQSPYPINSDIEEEVEIE